MAKSHAKEKVTKHKRKLSFCDLYHYLHANTPVRPIRIEELKQKVIEYRNSNGQKRIQSSPKQPTIILNPNAIKTNLPSLSEDSPRLSRALESFPSEVQLCTSSLPCVVYGVCARQHIPIGTWIGPYEGRQLKPNTSLISKENFYMWEVFHGNQLAYYLDGSNEDTSSWMRFIACARHSSEQNLYAFQYCGNIYYRAFKEIPPGTELLVWYDEIYPQSMGIPLSLSDLGNMETEEINASVPSNIKTISTTLAEIAPKHILTNECSPEKQGVLLIQSPTTNLASPTRDNHVTSTESHDVYLPSKVSSELQSPQNTALKTLNPTETNCHDIECNETDNGDRDVEDLEELELHRDDEPGTGLFRCGQCDKVFPQKSTLQLHICTRAPNKPYECGFCGKAFTNPNDLRAHSASHCNEKPFKCGYCSRAFSGATTLNNHIRTHTGEKPFTCEKCTKTFSQGAQLSRHQRISIECKQVNLGSMLKCS